MKSSKFLGRLGVSAAILFMLGSFYIEGDVLIILALSSVVFSTGSVICSSIENK